MRCSIRACAFFAAGLLLLPRLVAGSLLRNSRTQFSRLQRRVELKQCPAPCACQSGTRSNGGLAIPNGLCYNYCSAPHGQIRYCGKGVEYTYGDYVDCRGCSDAQFFDGSYTVHQPASGAATQSIILLGPFNASLGWGTNWILNCSEQTNPRIRHQSRIVDVVGKPARWEGYGDVTAWYGYPDYDAWLKNEPVVPEIGHAVAYVHHLIEQEHSIVGDYRRIVLIGLHQGGNVALESALQFPHALGLVVSERGILLPARTRSTSPVAATSYVLTAGGKDNIYPASQITTNAHHLQAMRASVFMKTLPESDHFQWSLQESKLVLQSVSAALEEAPVTAAKLAALTDWTVAS